MVTVSVGDLREKLGEYLERVRAGEEVLVTEDGKVPVSLRVDGAEMTGEQRRERARMERLAAQGLVRLGTGRISPDFFKREPVRLKHGSAVEAVLAEREESPY